MSGTTYLYITIDGYQTIVTISISMPKADLNTQQIIDILDSIDVVDLSVESNIINARNIYDTITDVGQLQLLDEYILLLEQYESRIINLKNILASLEVSDNSFEIELSEGLLLSEILINYSTLENVVYYIDEEIAYIQNGKIIAICEGRTTLIISIDIISIDININVVNSEVVPSQTTNLIINKIDSIDTITLHSEPILIDIRKLYDEITDVGQLELLNDYIILLEEYEQRLIELKDILHSLETYKYNYVLTVGESIHLNEILINYTSLINISFNLSNNNCSLQDDIILAILDGATTLSITFDIITVEVLINIYLPDEVIPSNDTLFIMTQLDSIDLVTLSHERTIEKIRDTYDTITDEEQLDLLTEYIVTLQLYEARLEELKDILHSLEVYNRTITIKIGTIIYLEDILVNYHNLSDVNYELSNNFYALYPTYILIEEICTTTLIISKETVIVEVIIIVEDLDIISPDDITLSFIDKINSLDEITIEHQQFISDLRILFDSITDVEQMKFITEYEDTLIYYENIIVIKLLSQEVINKILLIPNIITLEDEQLIIDARLLYNTVDDNEEVILLQSYLIILEDAESSLSLLKNNNTTDEDNNSNDEESQSEDNNDDDDESNDTELPNIDEDKESDEEIKSSNSIQSSIIYYSIICIIIAIIIFIFIKIRK